LSANLTGKKSSTRIEKHTVYHFSMPQPIPSYLLAVVAGNIVEVKVGSRSFVISEPTYIDVYAKELEDMDHYVKTIEDYITPYGWGIYKLVIQPPSFPIGGMENPLLTFANPTIIVGDKSGISVAVHEIAHSWTGNDATTENWSNMWINEGMCVFLERKALTSLYGRDFTLVDAVNGNDSMVTDMKRFGWNTSFSSLHPNVDDCNPDDPFSTIPYEKGYQFLIYLESLIGEKMMQGFMRS